jgi:hypothetical protein
MRRMPAPAIAVPGVSYSTRLDSFGRGAATGASITVRLVIGSSLIP